MDEMVNENEIEEIAVDEVQYIVVKLGDEQYGIDISNVDNIVRMQRITRVPKSQAYYVGVINLRGEVVPIMSLRRRFDLEDDVYQTATRIIIIKLEDQSLIGFIVDEVKEVVNIDPRTIEKPNFKLDEKNASYLAGIGKKGDSLISLLDIKAVVEEKKAV
ncbi:MAG: purine-binding chemotaxis protein CheW [Lachnospiraceae bacterium]|nr:purine-binding chemotaxis protein CheW [Lachnospiraceae bacterium]